METIVLKPLYHRDKECIGIYFERNAAIQSLLQKQIGAKWSRTNTCWYVEMNEKCYQELTKAVSGKATLETREMDAFIYEQKKKPVPLLPQKGFTKSTPPEKTRTVKIKQDLNNENPFSISEENTQALQQYKQLLILKSYSPSTIRTYTNEFVQFLKAIKANQAHSFSPDRLKDYLEYCSETMKLSENTLHSRMNALKLYYEQVLGREKFFWEIPRPKKHKQLPEIFSQDEIAAIINSVKNKKHKAMLMLAYSSGMRVSEIVSLKTRNIDSKRMTIFIKRAKGKKDRIVTLSPVLLIILREYACEYKPSIQGFLFEGSVSGTPYSTRSLQEVLQAAKRKAGIMKPGSIHSLRHSFATHLIEKGTDVTMIQKLLGHNDIKTTLIYLHTSNKDLLKIISPLDDLKLT